MARRIGGQSRRWKTIAGAFAIGWGLVIGLPAHDGHAEGRHGGHRKHETEDQQDDHSRGQQQDNTGGNSAAAPAAVAPPPAAVAPPPPTVAAAAPAPTAPPAAAAPQSSDGGDRGGNAAAAQQANAPAPAPSAPVASAPVPSAPAPSGAPAPGAGQSDQSSPAASGAGSGSTVAGAAGSSGSGGAGSAAALDETTQRKGALARAAPGAGTNTPPGTVAELFKRMWQAMQPKGTMPPATVPASTPATSRTAGDGSVSTFQTTTTPAPGAATGQGGVALSKSGSASGASAGKPAGGVQTSTQTAAAVPGAAAPPTPRRALHPVPLSSLTQVPPPLTTASRELLAVNASPQALASASQSLGLQTLGTITIGGVNLTRLQAPYDIDLAAARMALSSAFPDSGFAYNRLYRLTPAGDAAASAITPASPLPAKPGDRALACAAGHCYGPELVGWHKLLDGCTARIKVGIVDTAIDQRHPALLATRFNVGNFANLAPASATNWHGTGIAAILAGAPGSATPGLIPSANFYVADIFSADETGAPVADTFHLVQALEWLGEFDVKVVNLSMAGPKDELVAYTIARLAKEKGIVFVAAAGNEGPAAPPSYPAAYPEVIAVTAVAKDLHSYRHANRGSYIDVAAPGVDIWTAMPGGGEAFQSGTSFAAPFVTAAVAAIYRSVPVKTKAAMLDSLEIRDLGAPGRDEIFGRGLLVAPASCTVDYARRRPGGSAWPSPTVVSLR